MRFTRLIGALLAAVLIGGLGLVSAGSATASSSQDTATRVDVASRDGALERRATQVTMNAKQKGRRVLLVGKVKPRKGPVIIQRATKCGQENCNFKIWKKLPTNKEARFKTFAPGKSGNGYYYQARVGSAKSAIYRVYRRPA